MPPFINALALSWLCCGLVAAAGLLPPPLLQQRQTTCPLTQVTQYEFYCATKGTVQNPAPLVKFKAKSLNACAAVCLSKPKCKSFNFIAGSGKCQLYSKFLSDMAVDVKTFEPGILYDNDCFSTDCNTIDACQATMQGNCETYYLYYSFATQYACSYGFTAQTDNFKFNDVLLNGTLSACDAVNSCFGILEEYFNGYQLDGSVDVHFDIASNQWVCRSFNDFTGPRKPYGAIRFPSEENLGHDRYTLKNASVGAGYGFFVQVESVM